MSDESFPFEVQVSCTVDGKRLWRRVALCLTQLEAERAKRWHVANVLDEPGEVVRVVHVPAPS